jgi:PRC-barrel domain
MMAENQENANWNLAEWHGKMLVDRDGEKIGKLQDVYVDVENDEPQFATVKEGFIGRHLTFVPLGGITVGPDDLQVTVSKEQVESAPNIEQHGDELSQADESALYHHFELNYTPASATTYTKPRRTDCDPPARHACASSNERASKQKHASHSQAERRDAHHRRRQLAESKLTPATPPA